MCGIFGVITNDKVSKQKLKILVNHSKQRGKDSSGLIFFENDTYKVNRADYDIDKLLKIIKGLELLIKLLSGIFKQDLI